MAEPTSAAIEDYLVEERKFPPPPDFAADCEAPDPKSTTVAEP